MTSTAKRGTRRIVATPSAWLVWGVVAFFLINLAGVIGSVVVSSVGRRWFDTWLPQSWTTQWYGQAWHEFALLDVLIVTVEVALLVVAVSVLVGVPA
jgi:putative spermidine/putrescine transport system permease protein